MVINEPIFGTDHTEQPHLFALRGVLPLVLVGVIIGLVSLLLIPWPTVIADDSPLTTAPHLLRLTQLSPSTLADVSIYGALVFALVFAGLAWRSGRRGALLGLIGVGAFGMLYATINLIPFLGPLLNLCGFGLILAGGALGLSFAQVEHSHPVNKSEAASSIEDAEDASENIPSESLPSSEAV